ncbi:hypothetical protein IT575_03670 [bacterium]|nr:hypothetical protein [bacterium]
MGLQKKYLWSVLLAVLAILLLSAALLSTGRSIGRASAVSGPAKENTDLNIFSSAAKPAAPEGTAAVPPIDTVQPESFETASFALG